MRISFLLLFMMGWAALMPGINYAAPADDAKSVQNADSEKTDSRPHASLIKKNRPQRLPNNRRSSPTKANMNAHGPVQSNANAGVSGAPPPAPAQAGGKALPIQSHTTSPRAVPSSNGVRHRGSNPPTVGGPANSAVKNSGAINGAHVSRKP